MFTSGSTASSPSTQSISVIIPTFNGQHLLAHNLPAVLTALHDGDEIIIVDDAGSDKSVGWLKTTFKLKSNAAEVQTDEYGSFEIWTGTIDVSSRKALTLKVVRNLKNLRFAKTCNRGVRIATQSLVLLLNNDVSPHKDFLSYILPHFQDPCVFAVGCREIEHNQNGIFGGKNRLWFARGMFAHARAEEWNTGATAWVSGGSGLFDKQKWHELGGFDPDYAPAYWEDIDLSYRARQKGWFVLFDTCAVVDHNHESTNASAFGQNRIMVMSIKNSLIFLWKNGSWFEKVSHLVWLPYHVLITNTRMKGLFYRGYVAFLGYLLTS